METTIHVDRDATATLRSAIEAARRRTARIICEARRHEITAAMQPRAAAEQLPPLQWSTEHNGSALVGAVDRHSNPDARSVVTAYALAWGNGHTLRRTVGTVTTLETAITVDGISGHVWGVVTGGAA